MYKTAMMGFLKVIEMFTTLYILTTALTARTLFLSSFNHAFITRRAKLLDTCHVKFSGSAHDGAIHERSSPPRAKHDIPRSRVKDIGRTITRIYLVTDVFLWFKIQCFAHAAFINADRVGTTVHRVDVRDLLP